MSDKSNSWKKRVLILPPIVIGVLVLIWMKAGREAPAPSNQGEPARAVRVIEAQLMPFVPLAEGYGQVRPARVWTAVSQVAGQVVEVHPKLRDGEILSAGTTLVRIDPADYELELEQALAQLAELETQARNAKASLEIEERKLALAEQDVTRKRKLMERGTSSQTSVDEAERTMLTSRTAVQTLRNTLTLIPVQRRVNQAAADRARRKLQQTSIAAPFTLRVADLAIEAEQYVGIGQSLFQGDDVERVEIKAQMAMSALRRLFLGGPDIRPDLTRLNEELPKLAGFQARVRLDLGNHIAEWDAEFVRFSDDVDPQTRTIGVVVAVDRPFDKIKPGLRPPLSKGMFLQVVLAGRSYQPRIVVPRSAIRQGIMGVVDADNRLRHRSVEVLFNQGRFSVIQGGLAPGERILVSDLVPAVDGMLLAVQTDVALSKAIEAAGGGL